MMNNSDMKIFASSHIGDSSKRKEDLLLLEKKVCFKVVPTYEGFQILSLPVSNG